MSASRYLISSIHLCQCMLHVSACRCHIAEQLRAPCALQILHMSAMRFAIASAMRLSDAYLRHALCKFAGRHIRLLMDACRQHACHSLIHIKTRSEFSSSGGLTQHNVRVVIELQPRDCLMIVFFYTRIHLSCSGLGVGRFPGGWISWVMCASMTHAL